jgi:hypothetical protein
VERMAGKVSVSEPNPLVNTPSSNSSGGVTWQEDSELFMHIRAIFEQSAYLGVVTQRQAGHSFCLGVFIAP